jgi:hypothetical protein
MVAALPPPANATYGVIGMVLFVLGLALAITWLFLP